jgi:superfamily I DNA/RNA helicase
MLLTIANKFPARLILLLLSLLKTRAAQTPIYSLRTNCRNTPRIAELVHLLGGLQPRYSRILRPDDRVEPELKYSIDDAHQKQLLITALQQLYTEGFSGNDIVILSPRTNAACAAGAISGPPWKDRLRPIETAGRGQIGYSSIHAFKGLEAPVVIVTDIDRIDRDTSMSLFYIAVTRALYKLIIFMHEHVKEDILNLLNLPT